MAENIKNTIIPFTYDEIKENIISKLVAKGYSAQVPGTKANLLADILTYIAQGINVNTAFQSQEMLLLDNLDMSFLEEFHININ